MGLGEFIEVLPPQMRVSANWYLGTADAIYQNIYSIGSERSNYVIILSGDHIYKMNYGKMLQQHVDAGADVTVATIEVDPAEAAGASALSRPIRNGASSASRKSRPIPSLPPCIRTRSTPPWASTFSIRSS